MSQDCYVGNNLDEVLYVTMAPNADWQIADFAVALAGFFVPGWGQIATLTDLEMVVVFLQKLGTSGESILDQLMEIVKTTPAFRRIDPGEAVLCLDEELDIFDASWWASFLGAETIHVTIITPTRAAGFSADHESDWIATVDGIYRGHGLQNKEAPFEDDIWTIVHRNVTAFHLDADRIGAVVDGSLWVKEGSVSAGWDHQRDDVQAFQLNGARIGVLVDGSLYVKEHKLTSSFVHQNDDVVSFELDDDRIGVLLGDRRCLVKEPELKSKWKGEGSDVSAFQLEGDRIGVLIDGALQVKAGELTDNWVHQEDGVERFQLDRGRIGVLIDGVLKVKENGLTGKWDEEERGVSAFRLHGNWIGVLIDGDLKVKKGGLAAAWTTVERGVSDFQIEGERIAVRIDGAFKIKDGDVNSKWSAVRSDVAAWQITRTRAAVLSTSGTLLVQEGDIYDGFHNWRG